MTIIGLHGAGSLALPGTVDESDIAIKGKYRLFESVKDAPNLVSL